MRLRDYQNDAIFAVGESWVFHDSVMLVMATGLGKTIVFSEIVRRWVKGIGTRAIIICPQIELITQAAKKVRAATGVDPAIEQGQRRSNEHSHYRNQYVVASKQSLTSKERGSEARRYERYEDIGVVIVDECDLAATSLYKEMLDFFRARGAKVLGLTATAKRHDNIGMKNLFQDAPYSFGIAEAIPEGWLCPPRAQCIKLESLDLTKVATVKKDGVEDFKESELAKVMEEDKVVYEIAEVTARESGSLKTAVYCATVAEARAVSDLLVDRYKLRSDWICADKRLCDDRHRADVLESFSGDPDGIQIVCNVGILCRGWDFPGLEHIVVARPTKSLNLYTQIFGRGTRTLEGVVDFEDSTPESRRAAIAASAKPFFKVTDLRDNSREHKLITAVDVLAGRWGIEVVNRAKDKVAASGHPTDLDQAIAEAQQEEAAEIQRRKRAAIEAKARYQAQDVDPFDGRREKAERPKEKKERGARMPFGKHKGKLLKNVPFGYLKWLVGGTPKLAPWLKSSIEREIESRLGPPMTLLDRAAAANQLFQEVAEYE